MSRNQQSSSFERICGDESIASSQGSMSILAREICMFFVLHHFGMGYW